MKLLAAGLSSQSFHALEMIAGAVWPGLDFVQQRTLDNSTATQACAICVVDLLGLGLGRWSPEREVEVMALVAQRPAVFLVPPGSGGGWLASLDPHNLAASPPLLLQHPVAANALRAALLKTEEEYQRLQSLALAPTALAADEPAHAVALASGPTPAEHDFRRLSDGGYAALLTACPDVARNPYLNLICNIVMRRALNELRITPQSGAVIHPAENWVSSNIPTALSKRMSEHELMLQLVKVDQPDPDHAYEAAQQFFGRRTDGRRPLDAFVWSLVFNTFEKLPPTATGDIRFVMHRFPNFSRLPKAPDLFLQLSLVCLQQPQSISELKKAFPRQDSRVITLFVVCVILSGMSTVLHASAPKPAGRPRRRPKAAEAAQKPGFLRSLLNKLF